MKIESVNYREQLQKAGHFILINKIVVTSVTMLVIGIFVLHRINSLTAPTVHDGHLKELLKSVDEVTFDDAAIQQISELNETNIQITSDFTDRDNPFVD